MLYFIYPGVGKTQLSMFLSVKTVLNVDGSVLYVDTKNDFCIERLTQMIETNLPKNPLTFSKKRDYVLDKIRVCKLYDLATLLKVLSSIIHNQVMTSGARKIPPTTRVEMYQR